MKKIPTNRLESLKKKLCQLVLGLNRVAYSFAAADCIANNVMSLLHSHGVSIDETRVMIGQVFASRHDKPMSTEELVMIEFRALLPGSPAFTLRLEMLDPLAVACINYVADKTTKPEMGTALYNLVKNVSPKSAEKPPKDRILGVFSGS